MMLKVVAFILVNVALTRACCTPSQWEGNEGLAIGYVENGEKKFTGGLIRVSYDAENEKIAAKLNLNTNGKSHESKVILDYEKKYMYVITKEGCNVSKLATPFKKACVPENAKLFDDTHFGAGSDSIDVSMYNILASGVQASLTVTNELCIPVGETVSGEVNGVAFLETVGFFGIELGIKNPDVFKPPSDCNPRHFNETIDVQTLPHHMRRMYAKSSFLGF